MSKAGSSGGKKTGAGRSRRGLRRDAAATVCESREKFKERVLDWARKLDLPARAIFVRPMSRKWASCSTAGTLSFNDELLDLPKELGDYVIVHELLHFSVPNHGKLWKSLMRAHLGKYEQMENELRKIAIKS
jgi:predicted metal-dependent hydrolase